MEAHLAHNQEYAGSSPVCSVGIYLITRKRVCSDCSVRHKILAESQGVQGINTWTSCLAGMYITPAIQDFQPIHPAVYLRAADPAGPVLRGWWVTDSYLQLQEPSGALFIFKGQRWLGGWSRPLSVHRYRYRGISGMFQRYRYILRYPGVRPRRRS